MSISIKVLAAVCVLACMVSIGNADVADVAPQTQSSGARTTATPGNNHSSTQIYIPYPYPSYPSNSADTYYRRLLDQYQQDTVTRLGQIQDDIAAVSEDIKSLGLGAKQAALSSDEIIRRLDKIERNMGNITGRLAKLETTVNLQGARLNKLSSQKPSVEPNAVATPVKAFEPNTPVAKDANCAG
jgi:hypothetical protein